MLKILKALYKYFDFKNSCVIVIDRNLTFINIITTIFKLTITLLCI